MEYTIAVTIISAVLAFALGLFWYHPGILGTKWLEARGVTADADKPPHKHIIISLFLWLLAASFYTFLTSVLNIHDIPGLFCLSCLLWVAFTMPPLVMGASYTGYAFDAVSIDAAYQLAGYYVFAATHIVVGMFQIA